MIIEFISSEPLSFNTQSIYDMCSQLVGKVDRIARITIEEKPNGFNTIVAYYFNDKRETIHFWFTMDEYKRGLRNVKLTRICDNQ